MKRSLSGLLLVMLTTLLGACGFHLRGTGGNELALQELDLRARDAYGEMTKDVRRMLESNGVRVHAGAPYRLMLVQESRHERTASYTSSARSAENELTASLDYELRSGDLSLLADRIEVRKIYVHDANNLIGSDQEASQLRVEMRRDLVQQLSQRLQQLTPQRLATLEERARAQAEAEARAAEQAARQSAPATPAR